MGVPLQTNRFSPRPGRVVAPRLLEASGLSHCGLVRAHNEDSWSADESVGLALVADGVGGQADGALASRSAVGSISEYLRRVHAMLFARGITDISRLPAGDALRHLQERAVARAVAFANRRLVTVNASTMDMRRRRGSTIVGLWAPRGASLVTLFHVGDSRIYLLRNGRLKPLTRDHSAYQQWLDSGSPGSPPPKSLILQALGLSNVKPDIASSSALDGDHFLLCSDGLTNVIEDRELERALEGKWSLKGACERLVSLGLARGGSDNLTAVVCRFSAGGIPNT
jgi:protein phosphatase